MKNAVYGIFVENPNIDRRGYTFLKGFELKAGFYLACSGVESAEVREIGL